MAGKPRKRARVTPPRPVPRPTSEIVLTQQHSLELVKTVITFTMMHVVYARHVFPGVTWQNRIFDPADPRFSYDSIMKDVKNKKELFEPTDGLYNWRVPKRGLTPDLDKLLITLESGVQEALEKCYLSKLQLAFHNVDDNPLCKANLIESYTMVFTYGNGDQITQITTETEEGQALGTKRTVLLEAKKEARALIDNLYMDLHNSDRFGRLKKHPLPTRYRMGLSMKYTDDTPVEYFAPKFRPGDAESLKLLDLGEVDENYSMTTGFHSVAIAVIYPGTTDSPLPSPQPDRVISGVPLEGNSGTDVSAARHPLPNCRPHTRSQSFISEGEPTQSEAMRQIKAMGVTRDPNSETQDTRLLPTQLAQRTQGLTQRNKLEVSQAQESYKPSVLNRIALVQMHESRIPREDYGLEEPSRTSFCECGATDDTNNLIQCVICGISIHLPCYGYLDGKPNGQTLCYTCLLQGEEDALLSELAFLCVKRRALHYFYTRGLLENVEELAVYLNRPIKYTIDILGQLQTENWVFAPRSIATGKALSGDSTFAFKGDEKKLRRELFRPQKMIEHHFDYPDSLFTDKQQVHNPNRQILPLTPQNLSNSGISKMATEEHSISLNLAGRGDCSSTQDTSTPQSTSGALSRTGQDNFMDSPHEEYASIASKTIGDASRKRKARSELENTPLKGAKTGVVSPWVRNRQATS